MPTEGKESPVPGGRAGSGGGIGAADTPFRWNARRERVRSLPAIAAASDLFPQILWIDRASGERWLALGEAHVLEARDAAEAAQTLDRCRDHLEGIEMAGEAGSLLRWFGGLAFDPRSGRHPRWPAGSAARFVLPRRIVHQRGGEETATVVSSSIDAGQQLERKGAHDAQGGDGTGGARPRLELREPPGERARWRESVRRALAAISAGEARKIVLARDLRLEAQSDLDAWDIVRRIDEQAPTGILFAYRFDRSAAFLGVTPERLFAQRGREVLCDCLAGTAPRGANAAEDERLAAALLASEKDRREHQLVLDGILAALSPLCAWLGAPPSPSVLGLPKLQHLSSPVRGWLRAETSLGELLTRLHPTPAVGGAPREAALRWIAELEGRSRGWYAGPIGWIARERADLAVAIRSAVVEKRWITAFGGAGVVRGSDPDAEWDETGRKAASLLSLFAETGW